MGALRPIASATPMVWAPCPICWGQRRIACRPEGRGYELVGCYGCLGVGETLQPARETSAPRPAAAPAPVARRRPDGGA